MTVDEKINLIDEMEDIEMLDNSHFEILRSLSLDEDAFVRSRCAALLINFDSNESLGLLLSLIQDTELSKNMNLTKTETVRK